MTSTPFPANSTKNRLNGAQQSAVDYVASPLLVLAGAGSGKTSVITQKIDSLVRHNLYHAHNIAAVTFTNKAAREMRSRLQNMLPETSRGPSISTFHQLGLKIIQQHTLAVNRKSGFSIVDEEDARAILRDILLQDGDGSDELLKLLQQQISNWKSQIITPAKASSLASSRQEKRWAETYKRYQQALQSYNALDFDDLIYLPVNLLRENEEIKAKWQKKIRYLLVDEYQDTNISQYELVKLIVGARNGLCVVGDDDQSIYTWRGANPENLQQLHADFPDLKVIMLEQNYRSTNTILRCANQLIDNNPHLFVKKLWSEKGPGDKVMAEALSNEESEAEFVCNQIIAKRLQHRCRFKDFAVLVRSNFQSKILELKLQSQQVPYHMTGGTSFFSRNEIKDILAYLRLMTNPGDDSAFLRIVNTPRRKIGVQTLEKLGNYAQQREKGLFESIDEIGLESTMADNGLAALRKFTGLIDQKCEQLERNNELPSVLLELIDDIDYENWLKQNSSSTAVAERRFENVRFLIDSITREAQSIAEEDVSLDNRQVLELVVNKLLLRDLLDQQAEEEADNKVQIMTMHAAKGLEFPHVFIIGFEENILPHRNSVETGDIDEERRLAYVGITRAQQSLCLTMARTRKQFGEQLRCEPSRFLAELPQDLVHKSGFGEASSPEENEKQGQQTLADLRALFS